MRIAGKGSSVLTSLEEAKEKPRQRLFPPLNASTLVISVDIYLHLTMMTFVTAKMEWTRTRQRICHYGVRRDLILGP